MFYVMCVFFYLTMSSTILLVFTSCLISSSDIDVFPKKNLSPLATKIMSLWFDKDNEKYSLWLVLSWNGAILNFFKDSLKQDGMFLMGSI